MRRLSLSRRLLAETCLSLFGAYGSLGALVHADGKLGACSSCSLQRVGRVLVRRSSSGFKVHTFVGEEIRGSLGRRAF